MAEDERGLAASLVAVMSPAQPQVAYIHFVGVRPDHRQTRLARELRALTAPGNASSIRFHERLGFAVSEVANDYNGLGRGMVTFRAELHLPSG